MYTRSSGRKIVSARTRRVPSIKCFFASLVSPDGPVMVTTGMVLLLRSGFRLRGPHRRILVGVVSEVLNELAASRRGWALFRERCVAKPWDDGAVLQLADQYGKPSTFFKS